MTSWVLALLLMLTMNGPAALAQSEAPGSSLAQSVFNRVSPAVYKIKTSIDRDASKASYGTGWVVQNQGVLVTNYHVISEAVQEPQKYKIYLIDGEETLAAEIIRVDVVNDLALIKVNKNFSNRLQLADQLPRQGAKIFSIGFPEDLNLSITEGNYNEVLARGPYQIIHMANALNGGMSGGPTVNTQGKVVGVNVSVLLFSQNISFAVPLSAVKSLMKDIPTTIELPQLHKTIEAQLLHVQESLMQDLAKNEVSIPLPDWKVRAASDTLKCWADNQDETDELFKSVSHSCHLDHAAYIRSEVHGGSYRMSYRAYHSDKLDTWQMYKLVNEQYNAGAEGGWIFNSVGIHSDKKIYTKYDCNQQVLVNQHGIPFLVNYCVRGLVRYPSLVNANLKAVSLLRNGKFIHFEAGLWAYQMENVKKFLKTHLNGIQLKEKAP